MTYTNKDYNMLEVFCSFGDIRNNINMDGRMTIFIEYENEIVPYDSFEDYLSYHGIEKELPKDIICAWDKPIVGNDGTVTRKRISRETLQAWLDEIVRDAKEEREHIKLERMR
jgi:hypothetical protein